MANAYSAPDFTIDTACTHADLVALKGGAIAATDIITRTAEVDITFTDVDVELLKFVFNAAGSFNFIVTGAADKTLTLHDTSTSTRGWTGSNSNASVKFDSRGSAGGRWVLKSNSNRVCGLFESVPSRWKKEFYGGTCDSLLTVRAGALYAADQYTDIDDVEMLNCAAGLYFDGTAEALRTANNIHFNGCGVSLQAPNTLTLDILDKFKAASLKMTYAATGSNEIRIMATNSGGHSPLWFGLRFNDADFAPAPTWTSDAGIAALADNGCQGLDITINAATHATGDTVRYAIYIRASSAPDSFGKTGSYYWGESSGRNVSIDTDASGSALVSGTTYYVIVKASTELSDETTNVNSLYATVGDAVTNSDLLKAIKNTQGLVLAK